MSAKSGTRVLLKNLLKFVLNLPYYTYLLVVALADATVKAINRKPKSLNGEIVLITGAGSGIGQQVVINLAKKFPSCKFVLWDINETGLRKTVSICQEYGALYLHPYFIDLSDRQQIKAVAKKVKTEVGNVTVLFNNAAIAQESLFVDEDPNLEEKMIKINLLSYMWIIREFLPEMISAARGHIICTSSIVAFYRLNKLSAYCASKYGVHGFLETLKFEIRNHPEKPDIVVSTVFPGGANTPMFEGHDFRAAEYKYNVPGIVPLAPEQMAKGIVDGILKEKETIAVPGWIKYLSIIYRMMPATFMDAMEREMMMPIKQSRSSKTLNGHASK